MPAGAVVAMAIGLGMIWLMMIAAIAAILLARDE